MSRWNTCLRGKGEKEGGKMKKSDVPSGTHIKNVGCCHILLSILFIPNIAPLKVLFEPLGCVSMTTLFKTTFSPFFTSQKKTGLDVRIQNYEKKVANILNKNKPHSGSKSIRGYITPKCSRDSFLFACCSKDYKRGEKNKGCLFAST